jgi:Stress responsive A/B Barrel Domain
MKLRHVVLFGFVSDASEAAIAEVVRRFAELKTLVPGMDAFEWGKNCSPEGVDRGHSHAFLLTFNSSEARDAYLVHPNHVAFSEWVRSLVSTVTVVDYWVGQAEGGGAAGEQATL